MNIGRRGFFGALGALLGAGACASQPSSTVNEIAEVQAAFERLRAVMERPIELKVVINGREVARQSVKFTPQLLLEQGSS